ncbi:MAG: acetyltransferase [Candidatus Eremiobacteraeota bacterium]|nr:acetyltransferase [Candidatus Eremiobacteraeota bacterium]
MKGALKPLVIWGARGHAKVLAEFAAVAGYSVVALFDNDAGADTPLPGVPLYHGSQGFQRWRSAFPSSAEFAVAVGGARNEDRIALARMLRAAGLLPSTLIHPTAFVASSARVGEGCQVLAQASVCADAVLHADCIVNTAAVVDHECILMEGVHVAPGAVLCGCVTVGRCSFIGAAAVVLPRVRIGEHALVAAGAVVTHDVLAGSAVAGVPAKPLPSHEKAGEAL